MKITRTSDPRGGLNLYTLCPRYRGRVSYKKSAISKHSEKPVNTVFAGFRHAYSKRSLIVFIEYSFFHSLCPENHGQITDFGGEKGGADCRGQAKNNGQPVEKSQMSVKKDKPGA